MVAVLNPATSSTGSVVARYVQGFNIDEPLAMLRTSATSYYEADGLGSITSLSNSSGSVVQTYDYYGVTSFGTHSSSGSITNPFRFTGREYDETGLYFYRARYYDPSTGRFLSEDPIGFNAGINFYRYVSNNPVNLIDPTGLIHQAWTEPPFDGRLHDDAAGGLEVLCTRGRNTKADIGWLLHSIFVRSMEISARGDKANLGHINRLVDETITLKRCQDKCEVEKPAPEPVPDWVNEENWWRFLNRRVFPLIS